MIKDILIDIVSHTSPIGYQNVKIIGSKKETLIEALSKNVILQATTHFPVDIFKGTFGLPNLTMLNLLLKNPEYKENPTIEIVENAEGKISSIHFQNQDKDYFNNYNVMSTEVVNQQINFVFNEPNFEEEFEPSLSSIQRLKSQQQINSEEQFFSTKLEKGNLIASIGGISSVHTGNFIFQSNIQSKLKGTLNWPLQEVVSILSTDGDKTIKISNEGLVVITVDSGLAIYNYIIPAQTK